MDTPSGGTSTSEANATSKVQPYECAAETMYQVMIYMPWAAGNVGSLDASQTADSNTKNKLAQEILGFQAYTREEVKKIQDQSDFKKRIELQRGIIRQKIKARLAFITNATDASPPGLGAKFEDGSL